MDRRRSLRINDTEGKKQAAMQMAAGIISLPASAFSLIRQIAPGAIGGISSIAGAFSAAGALISLGIATWGIYTAGSFRLQLNKILRTRDLTRQEQLFAALTFLKEKIAPTRKEREAIIAEIAKEHPTWSQVAKQDKAHEKICNRSVINRFR